MNGSRPRRHAGEYIPAHNLDVVIALGDGVLSELTAVDIAFVLFLARTRGGWEVRGGTLSLAWVAARLDVGLSTLKRSVAHLKRLRVIETSRSITHARYDISEQFRKMCHEQLRVSRVATQHKLHMVVDELATLLGETPDGEMINAAVWAYENTGLTGRKLAEHLYQEATAV